MSLHHGMIHGMIMADGVQGWYYTPPDNITRCLLHNKQKRQLQDLLQNSKQVTYQELLLDQTSFKLALFQYEAADVTIDPKEYTFGPIKTHELIFISYQ
jgi:hypothetical protein